MPRILNDALNRGVAGVQIGENANNFQLGNAAGGFANFNGGLNESVEDGLGGVCDRLVVDGKVKCFAECGTEISGFQFGNPLKGSELNKFLGANISLLKAANNSRE